MSFAWIADPKLIHFITNDSDKPISLYDHNDLNVLIDKIIPRGDGFEILLSYPLELSKNYYISQNGKKNWAHPTVELINKEFHYEGPLGAHRDGSRTIFFLWSPTAIDVQLTLFDQNRKKVERLSMQRADKGIWCGEVPKRKFRYYQYKVTAFGKTEEVLDPYAQSMEEFKPGDRPKAALINHNLKRDGGDYFPLKDESEFIGYEVHLRDFTIDPTSKSEHKGTYLGFCDHIEHLKTLGITHVQLLPLHSYATVDETQRAYQGKEVATDEINYNWGYDTQHYFIPQGWFSTDPANPQSRIDELKTMIDTLHKNGIGVIMDVVYNHIYHERYLEDVAPGCYIRRNSQGDISGGTGAGATLESLNLMTRRLIIDSLKYFQDQFQVDGFRFDLMGFLDLETMKQIRKILNKETILYGEAWEFTDLPAKIATTKTQLPTGVGAFNDSARNSYTGEMSGRGFVQGEFVKGPLVRSGIIGGLSGYKTDYDGDGHLDTFIDEYKYHCFTKSPMSTYNFLSIHDGFTLWDKINLSVECDEITLKKMVKLSLAMLLTSQGKVVLHGGDEVARSKPLAPGDPNPDRAHSSKHCKGKYHENSYRSPDYTNRFDWKRVKKYQDLFEYTKGLIELRKTFSALRYSTKDQVNKGLRFVAERIPNSPKYVTRSGTRHSNWSEMKGLKIKFIGGPPNTTLYIIGEVHGGQVHSKNPTENPFAVTFDSDGYGSYTFNRQDIDNFDLRGWEDNNALNIKLVQTPGEWDFPEGAYTRLGNNTITPEAVKKEKCTAKIDLSKINHIAGTDELIHNGHIAYFLDSEDAPYASLLVVHNANDNYCDLKLDRLEDYSRHELLVDSNSAGITPIRSSPVELFKGRIKVPGKSCAVIGCIK